MTISVLSRRFTTRRRPSVAWSGSGAISATGARPAACARARGAGAPRAIKTASHVAGQRRSTIQSILVLSLPLVAPPPGREMLPDPASRPLSLQPPARPRRAAEVGAGPLPEGRTEHPQLVDELVDRPRRRPAIGPEDTLPECRGARREAAHLPERRPGQVQPTPGG